MENSVKKSPVLIEKKTPADAADETPSVYGDTSGFLKTDCKINPATDKEAPDRNERRTLGTLRLKKIVLNILSSDNPFKVILTAPRKGAINITDNEIINMIDNSPLFFFMFK